MAKPLYSITALFSSPDLLMQAVEETVKAGYTKYDVHSPYPIHGIERAMRLRTSPLGYFALAFGLLCKFRIAYLVGWLLIAGCLALEHWIARRRSLNWINVAFFRLNAVVSAVFLVVTLAEVVFGGGFRLR